MTDREFRIGQVLRHAMAALRPNVWRWLALAALIQTPIIFYNVSAPDHALLEGPVAAGIITAVHVAFYVVAQAAVAAAMLAHLRGQQVRLGELLSMTLRPAPLLQFVVACGLLSGLLVFARFEFDLWFGYGSEFWIDLTYQAALYLFFVATVPVLVNERTGVLEALTRSVFLTRSHRAPIFGLYLLLHLGSSLVFFLMFRWAITTDTSESFAERWRMWSLISTSIGPVVWGVIDTSVYRALRLAREGVEIQHTPSVPDARIHASG